MIEFILAVYLGGKLVDQTQRFEDLDRCLYFSHRLSKQPPVVLADGKRLSMRAICKPSPKR